MAPKKPSARKKAPASVPKMPSARKKAPASAPKKPSARGAKAAKAGAKAAKAGAKAAKAGAKAAARPATRAAKPAKRASAARLAPPTLAPTERASLLKPPEGYAPLVADTIEAWKRHSRTIRIEGRSPAKLSRALAVAMRARQREEQVREQLETKLRPLSDARFVAEDALWSQVLDLYRIVRANVPLRPELETSFDKLAEHFARSSPRRDAGATPATPATPAPANPEPAGD